MIRGGEAYPERSRGGGEDGKGGEVWTRPRWCLAQGARTSTAVFVFSALFVFSGLSAQSLAQRIDTRLDRPPFNRQFWGVALVDQNGRLLYGRNETRLFVPASTAKLVVSAVASALLPPDWKVKTSLFGGPVVGGVLQGDLVLYGRGDPTMGRRCYATDSTITGVCDTDPFVRLRRLADGLKARGIRAISGDIVGDGSYFEPTMVHPNWESFDLNWWYAAPVSGLGFNDNSVDFDWQPGAAPGAPALITMRPDLGDIGFENRDGGTRRRIECGRPVLSAPGHPADLGRGNRRPGPPAPDRVVCAS
jgi:D-alanyl-D-alanine carboxypeptidase/D-alanyl-D-alanine-endopeptidase (penicillin-binding protein 4)